MAPSIGVPIGFVLLHGTWRFYTVSSQSAAPSATGQQPEPAPDDTADDRRAARARDEDMTVALLKQGGLYEVEGASGQTYRVDISDQSCSCPDSQKRDPDGGCKHVRRVDLELEQDTIPRPDGTLPTPASPTDADGGRDGAAPPDGDSPRERAALIDAIRNREDELARLQAEIDALEFVTDTLETIADPDADFSLDTIRPEDH